MDIEGSAREQGWVPQEEWSGPKEKWVDAETFVQRGENFLPIVKSNLDKSRAEVDALKRDVAEAKKVNAEFREFQNKILENTKKRYENEIAQLKADKKQAAKDGDLDAVVRYDERLEEVEAARSASNKASEPAPVNPNNPSPEDQKLFADWMGANDWYEKDMKLRAYADGYAQQLAGKYAGREFLDKLREGVKEAFPDHFENPNRQRQDVGNGTPKGGGKKGRTYSDLPAEAKAACDRFVKNIKGFTVEQYLSDYEWD